MRLCSLLVCRFIVMCSVKNAVLRGSFTCVWYAVVLFEGRYEWVITSGKGLSSPIVSCLLRRFSLPVSVAATMNFAQMQTKAANDC